MHNEVGTTTLLLVNGDTQPVRNDLILEAAADIVRQRKIERLKNATVNEILYGPFHDLIQSMSLESSQGIIGSVERNENSIEICGGVPPDANHYKAADQY